MNLGPLARQRNLFPVLMLSAEIVFFQSLNSTFLSRENLLAIGTQLALILPLALAGTYLIMMGSFDLSITSVLALSGVVTSLYFPSLGYSSIVVGLATGLVLGALTGTIFVLTGIPSFIVTIGTMVTYQGLALILMSGGQSIQVYTTAFRSIAVGKLLGVDLMIVWALLILLASLFVFTRTTFGRHTYAIGANIEAARRAGINVKRHRVLTFMISGFLSAVVGILYVAWSGQASAGIGSNLLLPAVAAMVIGGNPITGGIGGPHRTMLGAVILSMLSNGLIILVVPFNIQTIIYGIVVIITIAATLDRERIRFIR